MDVKGPKRMGHTAKYLAWKAEREEMLKEKRKRAGEANGDRRETKRARSAELAHALEKATLETVERLNDELAEATVDEYQREFGDRWQEALEMDLSALEKGQERVGKLNAVHAQREARRRWEEKKGLEVKGMGGMLEFDVRT